MDKLAKDVVAGDRVRLEDGDYKRVREVARGFVAFQQGNGKRDGSTMITFTDGDWSQVPAHSHVTVEDTSPT